MKTNSLPPPVVSIPPTKLEGWTATALRDHDTHVEALVRYNDDKMWVTLESREALHCAAALLGK
jgi:hypothetical protein